MYQVYEVVKNGPVSMWHSLGKTDTLSIAQAVLDFLHYNGKNAAYVDDEGNGIYNFDPQHFKAPSIKPSKKGE